VTGAGTATFTVGGSGKAAKALRSHGVKVGALAPAKKRGRRIKLPVSGVVVRKSATVKLSGGVRFKAGKHLVSLRAVRLTLAPRRASVTARVGKRRVTVLAARYAKGKAKLDSSKVTVKIAGAKLALTAKGAKLLRARLAVEGIRAGALGKIGVSARPGETGGPRSGPLGEAPPILARPASAVDVTGISITWFPRDSWVRYLSSGVGPKDGIFATGGATKVSPTETSSHPCSDVSYSGSGSFDYGYRFTARSGWYDPPTAAAAVYGRGKVRFVWEDHTIDLAAASPEIELDGPRSRAIFEFTGRGGTVFEPQRADLVNLDLAGQPVVSGKTRTYTAVRGRLTDNGQSAFADFYPPPNDGFGCVTVSFTTP
jgi:hypothetical protein